jgi:hypothetical protein
VIMHLMGYRAYTWCQHSIALMVLPPHPNSRDIAVA